MKEGSPEWFNHKAKEKQHIDFQNLMEQRRSDFIQSYSPENLSAMSGEDLLKKVFSKNGMIGHLMSKYGTYCNFGTTGDLKYLYIVYRTQDGDWRYRTESGTSESITKEDAKKKAIIVRDDLLSCINIIIQHAPYNCESDYVKLDKLLARYYFSKYVWVMKYYQMLFPQFFPGMYGDDTLERAMKILGLSHTSKRLINAGIISLFIRKCNINNIVFNNIYAEKWDWGKKQPPCENASGNAAIDLAFRDEEINLSYYRLPYDNSDAIKLEEEAAETNELLSSLTALGDNLGVIGYDREILTKGRVNHGIFRERLLAMKGKCDICGVSNPSLLIASHIKPWANSTQKEKTDMNNGLLLCPNHDKLFDRGFISFSADGCILISEKISKTDCLFLNIQDSMRISVSEKSKEYLAFHREHIFQR